MSSKAKYQVQRLLEWYPKEGDDEFLIGEEELKGISLNELRELFGISVGETDDPLMYNIYQVREPQLKRIQKAVSHKIDLSMYDYFVGAYQK